MRAQTSHCGAGARLAYTTGPAAAEVAVRNLATGRTRTIDLARLIGPSRNLVDSPIAWLADGSDVVAAAQPIPIAAERDGTGGTHVGARGAERDSCNAAAPFAACLVVIHVPPAGGQLSAHMVMVPGIGGDWIDVIGGDAAAARSLLIAGLRGHNTLVDRVAFDPLGSQLLYIAANATGLWDAGIAAGHLVAPRLLLRNPRVGAIAW